MTQSDPATVIRHTGIFGYDTRYIMEAVRLYQGSPDDFRNVHRRSHYAIDLGEAIIAALSDGRSYTVTSEETRTPEGNDGVLVWRTTVYIALNDARDAQVGEYVARPQCADRAGRPSFVYPELHQTSWEMHKYGWVRMS